MEIRKVEAWPRDLGKLKAEKQKPQPVITAWLLHSLQVHVLPGSFAPAYLEPVPLLLIFTRTSDHIMP